MCLAIPGQVVWLDESKSWPRTGRVAIGSDEPRTVDLSLLLDVEVGDFVVVHSGFAIRTVDAQTALEAYGLIVEKGP